MSAAGFQTSYERGMSALAQLPLTKQLDAMHAYGQLRTSFLSWLKEFAESGRVVTKEDVEGFFAGLKQEGEDVEGRRVKQRTE